jgi:tetratricopeptide (TPR) repeat protein
MITLEESQRDELLMELVDAALEQPSEDRASYLRSACGDDAVLCAEVEERVQWEQRMGGFLRDAVINAVEFLDGSFECGEHVAGRYRILREVGRGAMGVVYEAFDERLERHIAIKAARPGYSHRLPPEARAACQVAHFNVCKVHDLHCTQTEFADVDFLTMEFIDGETLSARIRRAGPLTEHEARDIALQICAGLAQAHRQGVIHGDLKCGNIILAKSPEGGTRAVLTDFGLAKLKLSDGESGKTSQAGGSFDYMAPELFAGVRISVASDVYALGVIFHEMLTGKPPVRVDVLPEISKKTSTLTLLEPVSGLRGAPRCDDLPSPWGAIVTRCLESSAEDRFRDADTVARALMPRSRRWLLNAAAGVVLALVTGVVTYLRVTTPAETVRLAVLPFDTDAATASVGAGLLQDTGDRLSHVKGGRVRFTLIPLKDALRNNVDRSEQAESRLGATHSLSGTLRQENGRILVRAYLTDARTRLNLADWSAGYAPSELRNLPLAMAGMVTGTLRLPPLALTATVNAKAYPAWAEGVSLARGDPKDIDRALDLLERAVAADPSSPLTHACLAEAELQKYLSTSGEQWWNRARESLKAAERLNPDVAAVRFVSALINGAIGHYDEARADLQRAIEIEPLNGDLWRQLASVYRRSNRPNEARAALQKAIQFQPGYFKNYEELGNFYYFRYEFEEAVRQYKKMVELAPGQSEAHFLLSTPYLNMGRYPDAEHELRLAMKIQETSDVVHTLAVSLMYQDRDREAISYYLRALELGPPPVNKYLLYLNLGTSYRRSNQPEEAERAYRKALELAYGELEKNPKNGYIRSCVAYLLARLGDRQGAEANAVQALGLTPGDVNVPWMVALTYEALEERERTLSLIRNGPDWLLSRLNRFPDLADLQKDLRFQQLIASHHIQ